MSEQKVQIVQEQYTEPLPIDDDEIIDVSVFNFDDPETWLYVPTQCSRESTINDLYSWLKSEPELDLPVTETNRRCIDTRTFTRPKKRSSRMSFESIIEALSLPAPNLSKNQYFELANVEGNASRNQITTIEQRDSVPSMLKSSATAMVNMLSDETLITSDQGSMEAFLNMTQSKGIDSFINLVDPACSDLIMNISEPSILYSSIISLTKDDSSCNTDYEGMMRSEINQTVLPSTEAQKVENSNHFNETFSRDDCNDIVVENKSDCTDSISRTFLKLNDMSDELALNETYDVGDITLMSPNTSNQKRNSLSSTFINKCNVNTTIVKSQNGASKSTDVVIPTHTSLNKDLTMVITPNEKSLDTSTASLNIKSNHSVSEGETFDTKTLSIPKDHLDTPFKVPILLCNQSTPKQPITMNSTFKTVTKNLDQTRQLYGTNVYSTFKTPTSLRGELLAKIQRNEEHRLDSTYNYIPKEQCVQKDSKENFDTTCDQNIRNQVDILVGNKYNTYKKDSSIGQNKSQNEAKKCNTGTSSQKDSYDCRFYTFTKKSSSISGKTDMENAEPLENMNATFRKPLPKLQKKKLHAPHAFSKLPQFLQKSNPNLVSSSLKTVNTADNTNVASFGFIKGSQPNIVRDVERTVTNKLHSLGNLKSGSEQRLLEVNINATEFQVSGTGGSTESIESTQSAHSAPDLDERLSSCSDNSHNSYNTHTMNIKQLHQIVRMQEESLRQESTPLPNKRSLEDTWIEIRKNLPSPITKNNVEYSESDSGSPLTIDSTVKTSSPIISGSSQSLNTDGNSKEDTIKKQNDLIAKKIETTNKPGMKLENKTRLRQPTNWNVTNTTNRPVMSGIPRPPSRIPALRFTRPNIKSTQGDMKKECM